MGCESHIWPELFNPWVSWWVFTAGLSLRRNHGLLLIFIIQGYNHHISKDVLTVGALLFFLHGVCLLLSLYMRVSMKSQGFLLIPSANVIYLFFVHSINCLSLTNMQIRQDTPTGTVLPCYLAWEQDTEIDDLDLVVAMVIICFICQQREGGRANSSPSEDCLGRRRNGRWKKVLMEQS